MRGLTMFLYLIQPAARLRGRLGYGLSPWRHRGRSLSWPGPQDLVAWHDSWRAPEQRVRAVERALIDQSARVRRGDAFARWDLETSCGMLGRMRARLAVEEHGQGRQLVRMRCWPRLPRLGLIATLILAGASASAWLDGAPAIGVGLAVLCVVVVLRIALDLASAAGAFARAFQAAA